MIKLISLALVLLFNMQTMSQNTGKQKIYIGIEQDILPYLTGGYFACVWAGKSHIRIRALTAKVNKPDFMVAREFTNNKVTAYAVLCDYFLKENWEGWWIGMGGVCWNSSIQTDKKLTTAYFRNWMINGSLGYNINLGKHFYISPWCGLHVRVGGSRYVLVDTETFTPPFINPEASVKLGASF